MLQLVVFVSVALAAHIVTLEAPAIHTFLDRDHTSTIKGIGIIIIIICHAGGRLGVRYATPLGGIGVALFLICSGYGLAKSYAGSGLADFWKRRLLSVLVPYWIVEIAAAALGLQPLSPRALLLDLTLIKTLHPLGWYLQYLFVWYAVFYVVHMLIKDPRVRTALLITASLVIFCLPNQLWSEQAFAFTLGCLIAFYPKTWDVLSANRTLPWSLLGVGILALGIKQLDAVRAAPYLVMTVMQILNKLTVAIALIGLSFRSARTFSSKLVRFSGRMSYDLYLVHGYALPILEPGSYMRIPAFIAVTYSLSYLRNQARPLVQKIERRLRGL